MPKKLVIFDLDGTLINAYPAIIESFHHVMGCLGYPRQSARTIVRAVGAGDKNLLRPFVTARDLKKALTAYRAHHARALKRLVVWKPGARETLLFLRRRKVRTAVASNRPTRFTRIALKALKAQGLFDMVLCADRLGRRKPHPLILRAIMARFGVSKEETLYVGDMVIDVETGRRAGVDVATVTSGSSSSSELKTARPEYVMKDLKGLRRLLTNLL